MATLKVRCKVPNVVGLTLKKARTRIVQAHCRLGKVTKKVHDAEKEGQGALAEAEAKQAPRSWSEGDPSRRERPAPVAVSPRPKAATYCDGVRPA
jgi:hypothetical protein